VHWLVFVSHSYVDISSSV